MKLTHLLIIIAVVFGTTACKNWIFRIDVPQGNYLDDRDVKKLRINMTKEQVIYVLGHPVVEDSFDQNTWYYVYEMKRGMSKRGEDFKKELVIDFEDGKLQAVRGDFELDENFNVPLDS
ncbi:outer membrane protein assembly factor BamE [Glaciecola sp. MH2013]|uniref:outer membrane protein assembly factor BamE n=1 Tax=Glaciecola sp. MH2013 TaxID=2785524 RepID=UPI0018A03A4F|nr:outer membrane protein assembly factor BamE [Glaciecola sp. MH2013]MBF7072527.1 outer membrane protein assembly factor BamE [Glaciecola sp. MH2013]